MVPELVMALVGVEEEALELSEELISLDELMIELTEELDSLEEVITSEEVTGTDELPTLLEDEGV